jgi:TolB protein
MTRKLFYCIICLLAAVFIGQSSFAQSSLGVFDDQTDVGVIKINGYAHYDPILQQYEIAGSGNNVWANNDGFHFVWKRLKGDFILRTNASFIGKGAVIHRKLGWMIRTSLDSTSKHICATVHGDGLTSFQYRRTNGGTTEEKKSTLNGADVIQLERRGNVYTMSVARHGEPFITEKIDDLDLGDEVYAGLFVCSHNNKVSEKAVFNNVRIDVPEKPNFTYKDLIGSDIEVLDLATQNSTIIYQSAKCIQAPNWTKDGKSLIYNANGGIYKFNLKTNTPELLNTGEASHNNNDHVLSFDGKMLALSSDYKGAPAGYIVPVNGGAAKRITNTTGDCYLHGWSPDGKYVVLCGDRGDKKNRDVYKVSVADGSETKLTDAPGLDDGPEYTPDGKYIYFCSVRSGLMQVWRMKPDGSEQTQVTNDNFDNWFPHISPDGKWIVFISFTTDEVKPSEHPFYKHVYLRLMPIGGGPIKVVAYLYGGQGTINTPSWSPDSKKIAFTSSTQLYFPAFPMDK